MGVTNNVVNIGLRIFEAKSSSPGGFSALCSSAALLKLNEVVMMMA